MVMDPTPSQSTEMWVYSNMQDFTLNEPLEHHSPMATPQQPESLHFSPQSTHDDYWLSPMTPAVDAIDTMYQPPVMSMYLPASTAPVDMVYPTSFFPSSPPTMLPSSSPVMDTAFSVTHPLSPKKKSKKVHRCPQCNHTSNRANNMKEHIMTHDPNRPKLFACNSCHKRFARKHDMKRHTKSHAKLPKRLVKK
ncbi:hypothetical protein DM01DRAFT_1332680 [Hesseltinella vesiculosa]|uniref:C2H2-type domain-containing protein n=1 Tax=Hesseltinella vesiculosa TaxID=101127 RepID=A0A1X2GSS7_9FUNG|nr:hypothetical protein DM01DRAFT_1332680 [Hesseltinella vesiculosa]